MLLSRIPVVPTILVLIVGLAIGAAVAFGVREDATVSGQDDPCYGFGELLSTRTYTVTEQGAENAKMLGLDLIPGEEREVRECRVSPIEQVTLDGPSGIVVSQALTIDEAVAFYTEKPEDLPANKAQEDFEQSQQDSYVPAEVPTDLMTGCDPSWVTSTFEQVQAAICHPAGWETISDNAAEGGVSAGSFDVVVLGIQIESHNTTCASPTFVDAPSGTARVCALNLESPSGEPIIHYAMALPNGRNVSINVFNDATAEDETLALSVAASVQTLASFVPPEVSADQTAGCDPTWATITFEQVQAVMCHPPIGPQALWTVKRNSPISASVGTDTVEIEVLGSEIASHNTQCASPESADVPSGTASICALDVTQMPGVRAIYGVVLPSGRNVNIFLLDAASAEDEALALRVAANVGTSP